jgi:hypothetical protein
MRTEDAPAPAPKNLLHWLLLYPGAVLALGGSVPTAVNYVKAFLLDVSASRVQIAEEQKRLLERNTNCMLSSPVYEIELSGDAAIGVTICTSGDTLIRYRVPERGQPTVTFHWVPYPGSEAQEVRHSRATEAEAGEVVASITYGRVRCTRVEATQVIGVVQEEGADVCRVVTVAFATSSVTGSYPVSCSQAC